VIEEGIKILKEELRITSQRVNLFEKVKIPEAREAIRLIKIYLGDQMANAVGRSKIAKKKISEATLYEAVAS
jgi:V/A-type H+-transporting ATPase subunit D